MAALRIENSAVGTKRRFVPRHNFQQSLCRRFNRVDAGNVPTRHIFKWGYIIVAGIIAAGGRDRLEE